MNKVIETKDIDIKQLSTKPEDAKLIDDYNYFKTELDIDSISDPIEETDICKYGNHFFFYNKKDGKALFYIQSKTNFLNFLNEFYNSKETDEKQILVDLNNLKLSIYAGDPSIVGKKEQEQIDRLDRSLDIPTLQQATEKLKAIIIDQLQDTKGQGNRFLKGRKNTKEEREIRNQYQKQLKSRLDEVEKIERDLQKIQKGGTDFEIVNEYRGNNKLAFLFEKIDDLTTEVLDIDDAMIALSYGELPKTPYFDYKIRGRREAQKLANSLNRYNTELIKITQLTQVAAGERLRQEDLIALQEYLTGVINGTINPATQPFTPEQERAYKALQQVDPTLQNTFGTLPASGNISSRNIGNINTGTTTSSTNVSTTGNLNVPGGGVNGTNNNPETQQQKSEYKNRNEALANGGTNGVINYLTQGFQDQSPRGQQFYKTFGNVALIFGGIFLATKFIGSAWRIIRGKASEDKNDRAWFLGTSGLLLATAGRPREIFKGGYASEQLARLFSSIGLGPKTGNSGIENLPQATVGAMSLFAGKKYSEIIDKVEKDSNGKFKLKKSDYKTMVDQANAIINGNFTPEQKQNAQAQLSFLNSIGEDDKFGAVDLAITTLIGEDALYKTENRDKLFDQQAANGLVRIAEFTTYMASKGFEKTNPEMDESIKNFIRNGTPTLDELEARGAFEKIVDIPDTTKGTLDNQINSLTELDNDKKKQLREAVYQFYMDLKDPRPDIKLENKEGKLVMTTYNQSTPLDLTSKGIPGLINKEGVIMTFPTTKELLRVANLTNRIKNITRTLEVKDKNNPFHVETMLTGAGVGGIAFDNENRYKLRTTDLTVISNDGLKKISQQLSDNDNKKSYVEYLNKQKHRKGGENNGESFIVPVETPIKKPEDKDTDPVAKEKQEIETLKTNLDEKIKALETKIDNSSIGEAKKTEFKNRLDEQKSIGKKENVTKNELEEAIGEVKKIEEEVASLDSQLNQDPLLSIFNGNIDTDIKTTLKEEWEKPFLNDNTALNNNLKLSNIFSENITIIEANEGGKEISYILSFKNKGMPYFAKIDGNKIIQTGYVKKNQNTQTIDRINDSGDALDIEFEDKEEALMMGNFINYLKEGYRGKGSTRNNKPFNRGDFRLGSINGANYPDLEFSYQGNRGYDKEVINRRDWSTRFPSLKNKSNREKFEKFINGLNIWN